ncbi:hypothetical protein C8Q73DRAFT_783656 [Cubamyces lactineus]|nr:hypothetical protein C8Q73DRAFT_783656 [Cubamyces lactineus]
MKLDPITMLSYLPFTATRVSTLPLATLDSLPTELLEPIFQRACTDGGRTGASLALVSKRIHTTSRPFRFYSVSLLTGTRWQLSRFQYALERARDEAARNNDRLLPRVRHLCVLLTSRVESGILDTIALCNLDFEAARRDGRLDVTVPIEENLAVRAHASADYEANMRTLFATIGTADLETLCVLQHPDSFMRRGMEPTQILCPDGFPRLRDLTFTPPTIPPFVRAAGAQAAGRDASPMFPALRRMHMGLSQYAPVDFHWCALNTPRLEHLRISVNGYAGDPPRFLQSLISTLYHAKYGPLGPGDDADLWQELRRVQFMYHARFISPGVLEPGEEAHTFAMHKALVTVLHHLFAQLRPLTIDFAPNYEYQDVEGERMGIKAHYLSFDRKNPHQFADEVLRRDWLLRMTGHATGAYTPGYDWTSGGHSAPPQTFSQQVQNVVGSWVTAFFNP